MILGITIWPLLVRVAVGIAFSSRLTTKLNSYFKVVQLGREINMEMAKIDHLPTLHIMPGHSRTLVRGEAGGMMPPLGPPQHLFSGLNSSLD
jgi:hypothetical protein